MSTYIQDILSLYRKKYLASVSHTNKKKYDDDYDNDEKVLCCGRT